MQRRSRLGGGVLLGFKRLTLAMRDGSIDCGPFTRFCPLLPLRYVSVSSPLLSSLSSLPVAIAKLIVALAISNLGFYLARLLEYRTCLRHTSSLANF